MNSHVNPAFQGALAQMEQRFPEQHKVMPDPIKQAEEHIIGVARVIAELTVALEARNKTIDLREQNIRDLESERDELVEVMFSIVQHKGIAGTAAHTAMRDVLKRLGYDHSHDAREG